MFKSKITQKLTLYFISALLLFSFIIGSVFIILFENYTLALHKTELEKYASSLSEVFGSEFEENPSNDFLNGPTGYNSYIRFFNNVANIDVWIVSKDMKFLISPPNGLNPNDLNQINRRKTVQSLSDLPEETILFIKDVFHDKVNFTEEFSLLFDQSTLTAGVPMYGKNKDIVNVILLHSPISETTNAVYQGLIILCMSMILAVIIPFFLSLKLSLSFTKPLEKMKLVALELSQGNYQARCNILQNDEIGQLAEIMDIMAYRLHDASLESEKLERMRQNFVANISHELRTPVTVIGGSLEALCEKIVTDPVQVEEYHIQMLHETHFLQRLIGDLLDLSRLQNVDFKIEKSDINLNDILSDVIRSMRNVAIQKNIIIQFEPPEELLELLGDYGRIRQMFFIILDNALKFSPSDSEIKVLLADNMVLIRDYGIGIAEEELPYIFDRFHKTYGEQNKTGTGLGLAIAKQIADRHTIHLYAQNHKETSASHSGGAEFIFEFPLLSSEYSLDLNESNK